MPETSQPIGGAPLFVTTRWSVVLAAKDPASPDSGAALETLCRTYWYPLYAYVRSLGHSPHDAQDLTQEFFARLLAKQYLRAVEPEKGRFRTFLRMAMKRFLAKEWGRVRAQKRGGRNTHVSFDTAIGERLFQQDGGAPLGADRLYERRWALALLEDALARLGREQAEAGRSVEFVHLMPHLTAERGAIPYDELAAALGVGQGAARVAMHRLRRRFREVFRETIADTVTSQEDAEDELRHVLASLGEG